MKDLTEKASIYSAFISGVRDYLATENHDMPGRKSKSADTHRIALSLRPYFPPSLAFTPMPGRDFLLVYRFADDARDYIHIDKETGAETMLRQRPVYGRKEARQLHLPLKGRKKVTS